jgi:hypothetical protein|tara:strand:+ start:3120 stop:5849 length:2730 start_codon:yes stop_codon:yes gene_type:complete
MFKRLFNFDERSTRKLVAELESSKDHAQVEILKSLAKDKGSEELVEPLKQTIKDLLQSSASDEVRRSAMQLIEDHSLLEPFLSKENLATTAAARIIALVGADQAHPIMADPRVINARITSAAAADVDGLIAHATSLEQLCQLALRGNETSLHKILGKAEMRCEAALTQLEKCSRGHDKATNRLARTQLETIKNAKSNKAANIESLAALDDTIKKTLKVKATNLDALIVQRKKLNLLHEKRNEAITAIGQSETDLRALVEGGATYTPAANPLENIDISVPDASSNPYPELIKRLQQIEVAVQNDNALENLPHLIAEKQEISRAWSVASEQFPPNQSQEDIYRGASSKVQQLSNAAERLEKVNLGALKAFVQSNEKNIRRLLEVNKKWTAKAEKTLAQIAWPKELPEPSILREFAASIPLSVAASAEINAEQKKLTSELERLLNNIKKAVEGGSLKQASQTLSKARAIQKRGISGFEKDVNALSAQVGEMRDWQDFATHPKRDQLINDLQNLVDNPLDPENQADRLKDLRRQWNALGILRREEAEQQTRFDTLADQAFAVCKTYYAEQNGVKRENLKQRKTLSASVQGYLQSTDWANADIQAVEGIMRAARAEWRTYHPCDIKALRPVEKEFEAAQAQLYQGIKDGRDRNIAAKEAIVADAKALLELEDIEVQTTQAKELQTRWKTIGSTPRGIDQRLWRDFRAACNEIFKRLDTSKNAAAVANKEQQSLLEAAIAGFNKEQTDPSQFKADFEILAELADNTQLSGAHVSQLKGLRKIMEDLHKNAKQAKVKSRLRQWEEWDIAVSAGEQNNEPVASPHTIFIGRINGDCANEDLERLTLEAEIAAELASPAKEQALRMTLQVELMNAGRRNMQLIDNQEFIERWCTTGPKLKEHDALRKRFFNALEHRLA